ncbi:MAG: hypothetical protein LBS31_12765 [Candidatus Adiutrix sp.]|jgi:hypothetical protein|nr:hypothetical protein [Candidatus Adiutrix sp.]
MPLKKCEKGHYFNADLFSACPLCAEEAEDESSTRVEKCEKGHLFNPDLYSACPRCAREAEGKSSKRMETCGKGHYFDADLYSACPVCAEEAKYESSTGLYSAGPPTRVWGAEKKSSTGIKAGMIAIGLAVTVAVAVPAATLLLKSQAEREQLEQQMLECQEKLAKTFLVVIAGWETAADIDLHVRTPLNNHYYFEKHNRRRGDSGPRPHFAEEAEFSLDSLRQGVEIWRTIEAKPGQYAISIDKYSSNGDMSPTPVKLIVLHRDGTHSLTVPSLARENEEKPVMSIAVDDGGHVTIH